VENWNDWKQQLWLIKVIIMVWKWRGKKVIRPVRLVSHTDKKGKTLLLQRKEYPKNSSIIYSFCLCATMMVY
jgi:hypothetical protein